MRTLQRWIPAVALLGTFLFTMNLLAAESPKVLTPPEKPAPRINGPSVFGARPGSPFLYAIPATGERPMKFAVDNLPTGLKLDAANGQITGAVAKAGEYPVLLRTSNARGKAEKKFRIVVGDRICLTPPLGWNSWNCWAESVDQEKVLKSARSMVRSGLANHGWTYINIDDTWQGVRQEKTHALGANEKFPDMKKLCDEVHRLGLKNGIYSTPWVTSYAKFAGGSSDDANGAWSKADADDKHWRMGKYSFEDADARQWAEWGFDYLKYDWNPNDVEHTARMASALKASGRDVVYSLSNAAPFEHGADWARLANCWRTTGDIWDYWDFADKDWRFSVSEIGFSQDRWSTYSGPGHWNDPDMLVIGWVGWGPQLHQTHLTPDEQYTHISLWCMLSSPLLIGCDMERLDPLTLNLLSNDEVLAIDQDALGRQATRVATIGSVDVLKKKLEDGAAAVGFFNRGDKEYSAVFNKLARIGVTGKHHVRDVWRQADLPATNGELKITVPAHGVLLLKLSPAK